MNDAPQHKTPPLAGVIGWPIAHSLSPRLHGHWLRSYGLAGHYVALPVRPEDLAQVLRALPRCGFVGANVTVPHKEAALALADTVSPRARRIGAANTLVFEAGGGISADNTDGHGFMANLLQNAPGWSPEGQVAVLLGAGGAARAVVVALLDAGVAELRLTNRTRSRAEQLRDEFGPRIAVVDWERMGEALDGAGLVVNATAMGMTGQPPLAVPPEALQPGMLVTDLVYSPLITPLLATAQARGCRIVDGLGMLLHQAVPGFARWFGREPVVDDALRRAVLAP